MSITARMPPPETRDEHCARAVCAVTRSLLDVHNTYNVNAVQSSLLEHFVRDPTLPLAMRHTVEKALPVHCAEDTDKGERHIEHRTSVFLYGKFGMQKIISGPLDGKDANIVQ